jgi:hypothetical protein
MYGRRQVVERGAWGCQGLLVPGDARACWCLGMSGLADAWGCQGFLVPGDARACWCLGMPGLAGAWGCLAFLTLRPAATWATMRGSFLAPPPSKGNIKSKVTLLSFFSEKVALAAWE